MQSKLRIGIEAQRLFRPRKHGMDIVALELIRHLQLIDLVNEYFIFVKPDLDNQIIKETPNFKIIELTDSYYPIWEQIKLPRAVEKYSLHVLHCTSNTAPLKIQVPLIVTLHDIIFLEKNNFKNGSWYQRLGNLYRRWNVPKIISNCDRILTVSNFEQERIEQHFNLPKTKVKVVYNSVGKHFCIIENSILLEAVKRKYNLPDNFILFLANTDPKKNLLGVLKGLALLNAQKKLITPLVMLDLKEEYLMDRLNEIGATELRSMIHICGYVPNTELPFLYNLATIFLYPSLRESFGIPILEAMACGTPVITSNTSSMPEVAGEAALFVNPYEPITIATAIQELVNEPELRDSFVQKGLQWVKQFSWLNTAQMAKEVYESIGISISKSAQEEQHSLTE